MTNVDLFLKGFETELPKCAFLSSLIGYHMGKGAGPSTKEEAKKTLLERESMLGHLFVPGYTAYVHGKKGKARAMIRGDKD